MRVLLSGYYGAGNLGDEALLAGMVRGLGARGHHVEVLSADPAATRALHGVRATHRVRGVLSALLRNDLLVSGGGGLLQDRTSARSLRYYLAVLGLARHLGRGPVVFGQSLGPLSPSGERRVARALRGVPLGLRDEASVAWADTHGLSATLVADAALALKPPPRDGGGGVLLIPRGGQPEVTRALVLAGREAVTAGRRAAVLPLHASADDNEARAVEAATGAEALQADSPRQALRRIAEADLVLSGRLHGAVLATVAGVAHAGLVYDPKVAGFLAQSGGTALALPADDAAVTRLVREGGVADASRRATLEARCAAGLDWLDGTLRTADRARRRGRVA